MICPQCGSQNEDETKVCKNCGAALKEPDGPVDSPADADDTVLSSGDADAVPAASNLGMQSTSTEAETTPSQETSDQQQAQEETGQPEDGQTDSGDAQEGQKDPEVQEGQEESDAQEDSLSRQARGTVYGAHSIKAASNGKAKGALICGIAAIILSPTVVLGVILGIIAIVLSVLATKERPNGQASIGKYCGIAGSAISLVFLIVIIVSYFVLGSWIIGLVNNGSSRASVPTSATRSIGSSTTNASGDASSTASGGSASSSKSPSGSSTQNASTAYTNERFGFTFAVPDGFAQAQDRTDADGAVFTNESMGMTVRVYGQNNTDNLDEAKLMDSLWNKSEDSIKRSGDGTVFIYQYDDNAEYFYWAYVGAGSIDTMEISYPLKENNADEIALANDIMKAFRSGDVSIGH